MTFSEIFPLWSPLVPLGVRDHTCLHKPCLTVKRFRTIFLEDSWNWVYGTAVVSIRCPNCRLGKRLNALQLSRRTSLKTSGDLCVYAFKSFGEKMVHANHWTSIGWNVFDLADVDFISHGFDQVLFSRSYQILHFVSSLITCITCVYSSSQSRL